MKKFILPDVPTKEMLGVVARSRFPEDWEVGKRGQTEHGLDVVPPVCEYEIAYGQYKRLCQLLEECKEPE